MQLEPVRKTPSVERALKDGSASSAITGCINAAERALTMRDISQLTKLKPIVVAIKLKWLVDRGDIVRTNDSPPYEYRSKKPSANFRAARRITQGA
jgi:hypothetical protein